MKSVPENIYQKAYSISFPGAQSTSFSSLNSLQDMLKVNSHSSIGFGPTEADGKCPWQAPVCS